MQRGRKWLLAISILLAVIVLALALATIAAFQSQHPLGPPVLGPVVRTAAGAIQGDAQQDGLIVYRGVPFAAPPVGELRWRAPQPMQPWPSVLQATSFKPSCMQVGPPIPGWSIEAMSEDCLYLNIWAPANQDTSKLPVMVYLHGGGGTNGSPSARAYWGDVLVRHGVVTVNLSYRLGILGWLAHPELSQETGYRASGNYAVLDMIAGLQWVRDNIEHFGGDPRNVTLFGQSAGAFNTSRLMVSPLARGLFHKVIAQSGGDFHPAGTTGGNVSLAEGERAGLDFMESVGARSIADLRAMPAATLIAAPLPKSYRRFPVIDGYAVPTDAYSGFQRGVQAKIPLLIGYNELEGANLGEPAPKNAADFIANVRARHPTFASRILEMYPAQTDAQAWRSWARWTGERDINWNCATWARLHAATGAANVYVYHFAKRPPFGPLRKLGAAHGAELPYVFGFTPRWMRRFGQWPWKAGQDLDLAEQIPAYWTSFAKSGNPNTTGLPEWPIYDRSSQVLHFTDEAAVSGALPHQEEHALMDDYIERLVHEREQLASELSAATEATATALTSAGREF